MYNMFKINVTYNCQQYHDTPGEYDILYQWQQGFRSKRSTGTQLLTCIHELSQNLDQKKQTGIANLDFSKAFDKVPHDCLALKLDHYGVRGNALNWISVFLTNRSQCTRRFFGPRTDP